MTLTGSERRALGLWVIDAFLLAILLIISTATSVIRVADVAAARNCAALGHHAPTFDTPPAMQGKSVSVELTEAVASDSVGGSDVVDLLCAKYCHRFQQHGGQLSSSSAGGSAETAQEEVKRKSVESSTQTADQAFPNITELRLELEQECEVRLQSAVPVQHASACVSGGFPPELAFTLGVIGGIFITARFVRGTTTEKAPDTPPTTRHQNSHRERWTERSAMRITSIDSTDEMTPEAPALRLPPTRSASAPFLPELLFLPTVFDVWSELVVLKEAVILDAIAGVARGAFKRCSSNEQRVLLLEGTFREVQEAAEKPPVQAECKGLAEAATETDRPLEIHIHRRPTMDVSINCTTTQSDQASSAVPPAPVDAATMTNATRTTDHQTQSDSVERTSQEALAVPFQIDRSVGIAPSVQSASIEAVVGVSDVSTGESDVHASRQEQELAEGVIQAFGEYVECRSVTLCEERGCIAQLQHSFSRAMRGMHLQMLRELAVTTSSVTAGLLELGEFHQHFSAKLVDAAFSVGAPRDQSGSVIPDAALAVCGDIDREHETQAEGYLRERLISETQEKYRLKMELQLLELERDDEHSHDQLSSLLHSRMSVSDAAVTLDSVGKGRGPVAVHSLGAEIRSKSQNNLCSTDRMVPSQYVLASDATESFPSKFTHGQHHVYAPQGNHGASATPSLASSASPSVASGRPAASENNSAVTAAPHVVLHRATEGTAPHPYDRVAVKFTGSLANSSDARELFATRSDSMSAVEEVASSVVERMLSRRSQ